MSQQEEHHYNPEESVSAGGNLRVKAACTCNWRGKTYSTGGRAGYSETDVRIFAHSDWVGHAERMRR
jgi:hypothetical protein